MRLSAAPDGVAYWPLITACDHRTEAEVVSGRLLDACESSNIIELTLKLSSLLLPIRSLI